MSQHIDAVAKQSDIEALNSKFTTSEHYITPLTGVNFNNTKFFKFGNICVLAINTKQLSSGSGWVTLATIPDDCLPNATYQGICVNDTTVAAAEARVISNGSLQVYGPSSNMVLWGTIVWLTD